MSVEGSSAVPGALGAGTCASSAALGSAPRSSGGKLALTQTSCSRLRLICTHSAL